MRVSAQHIFKELDSGKWRPFYLIVGEEPFQAGELTARLKGFFIKDDGSSTFNFEGWDAEGLDAAALLDSLNTLPGLFDAGGSIRLVSCSRFDKASASALEILDGYFRNPSPVTAFLILASKADKRKAWYKCVDEKGYVVEVNEPYDREWPKWQGYFERKLSKRIESTAWEMLVSSSGRSLSLLWPELRKISVFVGARQEITYEDWKALSAPAGSEDVFAFVEDVLCGRSYEAMKRFHHLVRSGESEVKLLALLVRQFRLVERARELSLSGVTDSKLIASEIGTPPFFVSKILNQAKRHTAASLSRAMALLAECDLRVKTGEGSLFDRFLVPYFALA